MALSTPTTQSLSDSIVNNLEATLSQTIPLLPKAFTRVLAKVLAGAVVLVYKYAGSIFLNLFVATASMEWTTINGRTLRPLVEWGRLFGVGDPIAAMPAEIRVEVSVATVDGSVMAAGAQLVRPETGVVYMTIAPITLDSSTKQVVMKAASDQDGGDGSGVAGNLSASDVVQFANPLPNVARNAVVVDTVTLGTEAETTEEYRARVLRRVQAKPQGGAYADYRMWAEGVAGVAHAYPYTGSTPGYVDVYVEADADLAPPDGIPDSTLLDAVEAAIELDEDGLATRRPATANVSVLGITRESFRVVVSGLTADDPATVQSAINDGVDEHLRSLEPYIVGLSVLPRRDHVNQGQVAGVVHDIANAEGAVVASVELQDADENTISAHVLQPGEKAKLHADGVSFV